MERSQSGATDGDPEGLAATSSCREGKVFMRNVLLVANQTLAGKDLLATLKKKLEQGPFDVYPTMQAISLEVIL